MKVVAKTISQNAAATGNVTSSALDTNQAVNVTFQLVTADTTVAGAMKAQGSNDNPSDTGTQRELFVPTHWSDIPSATVTAVAGVTPLLVVANVACQYMRVVFTRTGGTTTLSVKANAVGA